MANTACAAARLGLRVRWAGLLGDDEGGRLIREEFAAYGVDASAAEVRTGAATDFTVILLDPSGERTILVVPVLPSPPPLTDSLLAALAETRLVYAPPHPPAWFEPMAAAVHRGGGLVAVDVEGSAPSQGVDLEAVLHLADVVFCNRRGLKAATGGDDIETGMNRLTSWGAGHVVVTLGSQGAWAGSRGAVIHAPGHRVPVVDTTGAGDCFHAAFIFGLLAGWPPERTLHFANAAAALSVQKLGPRAGLPTREEIEAFLAAASTGQPHVSSP
jgi:sugar/nucleoside kinase (ribokinase family)